MKYYFAITILCTFFVLTGCNKSDSKTESSSVQNTGQNADKNLQTVEFKCDGMTCTGCEETIIKKVKKLDGVKEVESDYKTKITKVTFASGIVSAVDIENTINKAGYHAEINKPNIQTNSSTEQKELSTEKKIKKK
ncbi:MAG: heavy-metal-associated domain-containing protein [Ignavibacteria bacterium]|nr:heavy-metal-associated domain-containing protein [Ignavibacteria bacterium]